MRLEDLICAVAVASGIPSPDILGTCRRADIVEARHVAMWCWSRALGHSTPRTARLFGRTHMTVIHACRRVDNDIASGDEGYRAVLVVELIGELLEQHRDALTLGRVPSKPRRAIARPSSFEPMGLPWGVS